MDSDHLNDDEYQRKKKIIITASAIATLGVAQYCERFLQKRHYSVETSRGKNETQSIIGVSDTACQKMLRMPRETFFCLSKLLQDRGLLHDSKSLMVDEQLVIFLHTIAHNVKNRVIAHQFGHSGETISRHFNHVLGAIIKLYPELLKAPSTATPQKISGNPTRYYPYFRNCIGAIDGSHIPAWLPVDEHRRFRDRHGQITQNILAACDLDDLKFTYILSGWEGSASDARILEDAIHREGEGKLVVPEGKFYLVDAGFANRRGFLRPYRNVRYHVKEWRNSNAAPTNKKELFNLRHSSLRCRIEQAFGRLKSKFKILKNQPEYPFRTQAKIVLACVLIHNHIIIQKSLAEEGVSFDSNNEVTSDTEEPSNGNQNMEDVHADVLEDDYDVDDVDVDDDHIDAAEPVGENIEWEQFRENIADQMWADWLEGGADGEEEFADASLDLDD